MTAAAPPPRETFDLVGHAAAEARLLEAWNSGRMPHAWLLTGPRGIGKATLAWRLARFALAGGGAGDGGPDLFGEATPAPSSLAVDPASPAARQVASGSHPDAMAVARSIHPRTGRLRSEIVVDDVRALSRFLALKPAFGGWRAAVVDCADEMNRNAANAMLKMLEEPPARVLFVLASHAPGGLLPTIRSRCRKLALSPLAEAEVAALLARNRPDLDPPAATAAARLAEGSIGRALEIADGDGLSLLEDAAALLAGGPPLDRRALLAATGKWLRRGRGEEGDPLPGRLELLLWWAGRAARRLAAGGDGPAEAVPGERRAFEALAARHGLAGLCARIEAAGEDLRRGAALNLDRAQLATSTVLALAE